MNDIQPKVQGLRPDREVMTRQHLPYFIGISGQTVNSTALSMHMVVIPPRALRTTHSRGLRDRNLRAGGNGLHSLGTGA